MRALDHVVTRMAMMRVMFGVMLAMMTHLRAARVMMFARCGGLRIDSEEH